MLGIWWITGGGIKIVIDVATNMYITINIILYKYIWLLLLPCVFKAILFVSNLGVNKCSKNRWDEIQIVFYNKLNSSFVEVILHFTFVVVAKILQFNVQ